MFIGNRLDEIKERIYALLRHKPMTLKQLSKEIGYRPPDLHRILNKRKNIHMVTQMKFLDYCEKKEKEYGIVREIK
jgi:hypothetical protein